MPDREDKSSSSEHQGLELLDRKPPEGAPLLGCARMSSTAGQGPWAKLKTLFTALKDAQFKERVIYFDGRTHPQKKFCSNRVRNQKYSVVTFFPKVLYEQFKMFANLYFLVVALSQFIPILKVGFLFTYVAPLVFVIAVTMSKEAYDDFKRYMRDKEANGEKYEVLTKHGPVVKPSARIMVGDIVRLSSNQRVPADMVMLRTSEKSGSIFIRTDQLDGETDWKLRLPVPTTQRLSYDDELLDLNASVFADKPMKDVNNFIGTFTMNPDGTDEQVEALGVDNTLWANTVVATGPVLGMVIYTGKEARSVMNQSLPRSKIGQLDLEINRLAKLLFLLMVALSLFIVVLKWISSSGTGFSWLYFIFFFRFILLFSSIIPISLRVNLDMAKTYYSWVIGRDNQIEGTIVRNSMIPEELGRVQYLFSDKTGTLTQNEMVFKKLHLGNISFSKDTLDEVETYLHAAFSNKKGKATESLVDVDGAGASSTPKMSGAEEVERRSQQMVKDIIKSLALCHNVTPVIDEGEKVYQAASPDEIALVKFADSVNLVLESRDLTSIGLRTPVGDYEEYEVLAVFPFTSERKRMGIIVRDKSTQEITFYIKGADVIMRQLVQYTDWLDEECDNMAREGLRTLVFAKKPLSEKELNTFMEKYNAARATINDRAAHVEAVIENLEKDLRVVGVSGVEDKLQVQVKESLEILRNAGVKIWMLTGDKVETATSIALSSRLVSRTQTIFQFQVKTDLEAVKQLNQLRMKTGSALVIDGSSLQLCLDGHRDEFIELSMQAPAVVCCRCSPTQKAQVVKLVKERTSGRCCAIGDGGNDVSMIQAADVGVGIVGKEGKQASMAADFSVLQFRYIQRLLLWHGRNSYKRSARLGQFVIHRGLIISIIQAVFSSIFYFAAIPIYTGWLMVGYSTFYTSLPVFSLVLDEDVKEDDVLVYPELYRDLQKGRSLSDKTFLIWVMKSVYQGSVIMLMSVWLFESSFLNIVAITFTALILTELIMVALEVHRWHKGMIVSEISTLILYFLSFAMLKTYFDLAFIITIDFWWKTILLTLCSVMPVSVGKVLRKRFAPSLSAKIT